MSSQTEHSANRHPDVQQLDRLHAGLLDHDTTARDALRAHLDRCPTCRERAAFWSRAAATLDQGGIESGLAGRLNARRQRALLGLSTRRPSRMPIGMAIAAAVTALAVGLGVLVYDGREGAQTTTLTTSAQAPDLYADIDFYLWLTEQQTSEESSPNS